MNTNKYTKKELNDFKAQIIQKKEDVLKDIIKSQDIADNMLENSNTSSVNYSSHLRHAFQQFACHLPNIILLCLNFLL